MRKNIENKLREILKNEMNIIINENIQGNSFFASPFNLSSSDLVFLFMTIKERFDYSIKAENIINGDFMTFDRIVNMLSCMEVSYDK